jgi:hypothetical protein
MSVIAAILVPVVVVTGTEIIASQRELDKW